jgi:hypothetical protein
LLVLIGLLAAEVLAVWVVTELVARVVLLDDHCAEWRIQESHRLPPALGQRSDAQ